LDEKHGEEASAVLKQLAVAVTKANEDAFKVASAHPFLVNLGVIMHQCTVEDRYKQPDVKGKKMTDAQVLNRAARMAKYAAAAYENKPEDILKKIHGDVGDDFKDDSVEIVHVSPPTKECLGYFIAKDKTTGDVVLSVRGTDFAASGIVPSIANTVPWSKEVDAMVNSTALGYSNALAASAFHAIEDVLKEKTDETSVTFVGHSIGGAAAVLAAVKAGEIADSKVMELAKVGKARCFSFGAPPVMEVNGKLTSAMECVNFINSMDVVPRSCRGTMGKLLMACRTVDEHEHNTEKRIEVIAGSEPHDADVPDAADVPEEMQKEFPNMDHIGTKVLVYTLGGKAQCETVGTLEGRILMHKNMASDHNISSYDEAILGYLAQTQKGWGCC